MARVDWPQAAVENRVLVLAPTAKDAALSRVILAEAGVACVACADLEDLCRAIARGAAAVILTEEALTDGGGCLTDVLGRQPLWSDLPLLVLTRGGADSPTALLALETLGNVTLLERPVRVVSLVSAVRAALRARRKQYQSRELLAEQEAAAALLRASEEQFRTLADSIPQLAWMARPDGHLFWYNRRWYDYTGTMPAQMEGWGWQTVHDPAELPRVLAKWRAALASGEPWEDTFPLRRRDGQMRPHLSRALPVRDEHGRVVRWFGTNTDITERLQMEQTLREADRRKDEFLAMLAHELRNPLAPIRNGLEILRLECGDDPVVRETGPMMERQLAHMVRLVDDLLDVSRITQGKIELRCEVVDVAAVVARSIEATQPLLDERRHRLEVSLPRAPLRLNADAARLEQILSNLLSNAAKYSEPGGRIELRAWAEGAEAVVRVRDWGIGIRADMLARVFDLFQQADRVPGHVSEGLGLGLTLVKRLTELHGGSVQANSDGPGKGSEFVVRLPLVEEDRETGRQGDREANSVSGPPVSLSPLLPVSPNSRKVLVVDDNVDGAESLALLLRLDGHEVRLAHDGPSALAAAPAFRPEVILLDIGLPGGMDGYQVARRLRQLPGLGEAFLVALTGYGQEEDRRRSREAGCDAHLVKPAATAAVRDLFARLAVRTRLS